MLWFSCASSHHSQVCSVKSCNRNSNEYFRVYEFQQVLIALLPCLSTQLWMREFLSSMLHPDDIFKNLPVDLSSMRTYNPFQTSFMLLPFIIFCISELLSLVLYFLKERTSFTQSYIWQLFSLGISVFVMLEIMTISTLFTFFMPSILFKSLVQCKGLFNFSLNRNNFLLLIKLFTLSTYFFFINYIRFLSMKCQKCMRYLR